MTSQPTERLCECGHSRAVHGNGAEACTRCPTSGVWVDSRADWVFPCLRYNPR